MAATTTTDAQNAEQQARYKSWYGDDVQEIPANMRHLLETYSQIPPDKIVPHVNDLRARGFRMFPYPCIGQFRFLSLTLPSHPYYPTLLARLRAGASYLDLGCCFGQDLRQLVLDGAPAQNMVGLDIDGGLLELGHELFLDRGRVVADFVVADIADPPADAWARLRGSVDVMHASAFFHLFNLERQMLLAEKCVGFMRPVEGSVIVGRQAGSTRPGEFPAVEGTSYRHDEQTLQAMWDEVGRRTGTRWVVEAELDTTGIIGKQGAVKRDTREEKKPDFVDENMRRVLFTITCQGRVE